MPRCMALKLLYSASMIVSTFLQWLYYGTLTMVSVSKKAEFIRVMVVHPVICKHCLNSQLASLYMKELFNFTKYIIGV